MSSIAFHTRGQIGYVSGQERAHLDVILRERAKDARRAAFGADTPERPSALRTAVVWSPLEQEAMHNPRWGWHGGSFEEHTALHLWVSPSSRAVNLPDGQTSENVYEVDLNSVIASSPPPVQLAVRIAAQCEVHGWIAGPDRAWFADQITAAVDAGVLRQHESLYPLKNAPNGWFDIAGLARSDDQEPLVMSYSVDSWFPDPKVAMWPQRFPGSDDEDGNAAAWERWGQLGPDEQWDQAVAGLRRKTEVAWLLQLTPDNLGAAAFGRERALTWQEVADAWAQAAQTTTAR